MDVGRQLHEADSLRRTNERLRADNLRLTLEARARAPTAAHRAARRRVHGVRARASLALSIVRRAATATPRASCAVRPAPFFVLPSSGAPALRAGASFLLCFSLSPCF